MCYTNNYLGHMAYEKFILIKEYGTDNLHKLELSLKKLKESRLKLNIEKYFFRQTEMECLGFWVTSNGVKPINKKNI